MNGLVSIGIGAVWANSERLGSLVRHKFRHRVGQEELLIRRSKRYLFFVSRKMGGPANVKITSSSPVTVLMSWCRLSTLTPMISWTIASMIGRAVSINWILTCFDEIPPLLGLERLDQMLFGRGQNPLEPDHEQIADQVGVDVLGAAAHVLLLKAAHALADGGFNFS